MKWSRKLRKKLNSLNQGSSSPSELIPQSETCDVTPEIDRDQEVDTGSPGVPPAPVPFDIADDLDAATGGHEFEQAAGRGYCIELIPAELEGSWEELERAFGEEFQHPDTPLKRFLEDADATHATCGDLVFFDLETTGFVNTPLFLIGTMGFSEGRLQIRQWFARHYGEEPPVISAFAEQIGDSSVLVSFNGKSFDLPYTRTRAVATRTDFEADPPHLDLLHISRRIWKSGLPDCRLQTLETHICGRSRSGDIPGADIPGAYHEYVRSGRIDRIIQILNHNVLDLLTMAELMVRMPQ